MKKLTAQEILDIIEETGTSVDSFAYCDIEIPDDFEISEEGKAIVAETKRLYDHFNEHPGRNDRALQDEDYTARWEAYRAGKSEGDVKLDEYLTSLGVGPFEEIEQYGGEEQGSTWYSVKYFPMHDIYIRTDGYYQSHHGTDFDEGYGQQVFPKETIVIVYEP